MNEHGSGFQIVCKRCTAASDPPRQVVMLETGRFTTRDNDPDTQGIPAGILGLRLSCPVCAAQTFFYPVVHHYTCEACSHVKQEYVRGDTPSTPRGAISFGDGPEAQAQAESVLHQLRENSIGGWGG